MAQMGSPKGGKRPTKILQDVESDKPSDIYYMIGVNCKYRKRIHDLLKELRNIN